jgi:GTPase SAR1 family protein
VLLGLDNAGKTTLLNLLLTGKFQRFDRTMRARQQTVSVGHVKFNAWDLGGHEAARSSWSDFYLQCGGVVFMVDAADPARLAPPLGLAACAFTFFDGIRRLQEALDEFQGVLSSSRCAARAHAHARCCRPIYSASRCILTRTHRSDQALPVAVMINKMDRKDAWPFPELEVPLPVAPRVQRSLTLRNRKASMTPPALPKVDPMMHRDPSRGTCAASRPVCPSPKGTR